MAERLLRLVRGLGVGVVVCFLTLIVLNSFTWLFFRARDYRDSRPTKQGTRFKYFNDNGSAVQTGKFFPYFGNIFDYTAMQEFSEEHALQTLTETSEMIRTPFKFHPWVHFMEVPYAGKTVNVKAGPEGSTLRETPHPVNPGKPVIRVGIFGGSTTFGYMVSDDQTIPAHLARLLNTSESPVYYQVMNLGHGGYFSEQEGIYAREILKKGLALDHLVFIDGVNEALSLTDLSPAVKGRWTLAFDYVQDTSWYGDARRLALLLRGFSLGRIFTPQETLIWPLYPRSEQEEQGRRMWNNYRASRAMIQGLAKAWGIEAHFVLQPSVFNHFPEKLFGPARQWDLPSHQYRHPEFYRLAQADGGSIDLSGLFAEFGDRHPLIDTMHYSPAFNRLMAERIAESLGWKHVALSQNL